MPAKSVEPVNVEAELIDDSKSEMIVSEFKFDVNQAAQFANVKGFVEAINKSWNKCAEGILEVGQLLSYAKNVLSREDFKAVIEKVQFSRRTVDRLIAIGNYKKFETHASLLSPSWATLYELTTLSDEQFEEAVANQKIYKGMMRKDVKSIKAGGNALLEHKVKPYTGKVKAYVVYCDESSLDLLEQVKEKLNEFKNLYIDETTIESYQRAIINKHSIQWGAAVKKGRLVAIKVIKDFRKNRIKKFGKVRFAKEYGEINDFFEGNNRREDLISNPFVDDVNQIDSILALFDHDHNCEYYERESLEKFGLC